MNMTIPSKTLQSIKFCVAHTSKTDKMSGNNEISDKEAACLIKVRILKFAREKFIIN